MVMASQYGEFAARPGTVSPAMVTVSKGARHRVQHNKTLSLKMGDFMRSKINQYLANKLI